MGNPDTIKETGFSNPPPVGLLNARGELIGPPHPEDLFLFAEARAPVKKYTRDGCVFGPKGAHWEGNWDKILHPSKAEINTSTITSFDRPSLIREMARRLEADPSWSVDLETAKALVCELVDDEYTGVFQVDEQGEIIDSVKPPSLPWPESVKSKSSMTISDLFGTFDS